MLVATEIRVQEQPEAEAVVVQRVLRRPVQLEALAAPEPPAASAAQVSPTVVAAVEWEL